MYGFIIKESYYEPDSYDPSGYGTTVYYDKFKPFEGGKEALELFLTYEPNRKNIVKIIEYNEVTYSIKVEATLVKN